MQGKKNQEFQTNSMHPTGSFLYSSLYLCVCVCGAKTIIMQILNFQEKVFIFSLVICIARAIPTVHFNMLCIKNTKKPLTFYMKTTLGKNIIND